MYGNKRKYWLLSHHIVYIYKHQERISKSNFFAALPPGAETEFRFPFPYGDDKIGSKLFVWVDYEYEDVAPEKGELALLLNVDDKGRVTMVRFVKADIVNMRKEGSAN